MARIAVSTYMVRYPLGGMLWWALQWPAGLRELGHEVMVVEKAQYPNSCFDPVAQTMSDDCTYGLAVVDSLIHRYSPGLQFCFVDVAERYHGIPRASVERFFDSADALIDIGNHGAWLQEAAKAGVRVLVDGEPGYTQMKWVQLQRAGKAPPRYDRHYTNGANLAASHCLAPTAGVPWHHVFSPVMCKFIEPSPARVGAAFTTVMNWSSHSAVEFDGVRYGQKDVEFDKFISLPRRVTPPMEIAVAGKAPGARLASEGWRVVRAQEVTRSVDAYLDYIAASAGEFSVAKNVFVATRSGWFSDRSAAYLASGRPVVIQDTGLDTHLPLGEGLFAVSTADEAADAIERIGANPSRHAKAAREIACEYLDGRMVMKRLVDDLGL